MDIEGQTAEELSAIEMNINSRQIVDVYHAYAQSHDSDDWARRHIHGLSPSFLKSHGFPNEAALINNFKQWLRGKDILVMYANDPQKEKSLLNLPIRDMGLPRWADRVSLLSHQTALAFKRKSIPIFNKSCSPDAHLDFTFYPVFRHTATELAKKQYQFHCSLYDTYALYLHYVLD